MTDKPVLLFCHCRSATINTTRFLLDAFSKSFDVNLTRENEVAQPLDGSDKNIENRKLLVKYGVKGFLRSLWADDSNFIIRYPFDIQWSMEGRKFWPINVNKQVLKEHKNLNKKIIFLRRKNVIKTPISFIIADNLDVTQKHERKKLAVEEKDSFSIKVRNLNRKCKKYKSRIEFYEKFLEENSFSYYDIYYEDLYDFDLMRSEKRNRVEELLSYLDIEISDEEKMDSLLKKYFSKKGKVNTYKTYSLIENVEEINEKLGDKYGYIKPEKYKLEK